MKSVRPTLSIAGALLVAFVSSASVATAQDYGGYRPHYQGYGVNTPGGRGGEIVRVTNLADSGEGSLRAALEQYGPRIVVFEVSGEIQISYPITITSPYLTVAGQTAPSPGVTVRGPGIIVDTHDVVLQHLRIRVGAIGGDPHALWVRDNANNVVVDHVSLSWAVWTSLGIYPTTAGAATGEVTVIDSLVYEALGCSGVNSVPGYECDPSTYPNGWQYSNSRGVLIGDGWGGHQPAQVTWLRSVSANNNDRHPEVGGGTHTFLVNSLIYNPSLAPHAGFHFHDGWGAGPTYSVVAGNVMIPGPTTPYHNGYVPPEYREEGEPVMVRLDPSLNSGSSIYLSDNYYEKHCGGTACLASPDAQWMLAWDPKWTWEGVNVRASSPPLSLNNLPLSSILPASSVEAYVTYNAGARPRDRDVADVRVITEILWRSGSVPNTPADKAGPGTGWDGFPILAQNWRPLDVPQNPHEVVDWAGRTRIEWWLEQMARELEPIW